MTDTVDMDPAGTAPATSRRREATRQKLLDAAAQVFAEEGLDAASVEAICERAGFTRGAFYSNFETKDELFLELAGRVAGRACSPSASGSRCSSVTGAHGRGDRCAHRRAAGAGCLGR